MEVAPGSVVAGRYRVDQVLGRGGMGVVVAATHIGLDERVAIKLLLQDIQQEPGNIERFAREARAAAKIKSEHVARVSDVGTLEDGSPFLVMEYLAGKDLAVYLHERQRLPIAEAVDYILQACEALVEAHALGIVHRDLKPSNLFLTTRSDGTSLIKVLDFGVSKLLSPGFTGSLTQTNEILGSPSYMPPEQMLSSKSVDPRSDIWAIGIILYELLTGIVPFQAESFASLCAKVLQLEPAPMKAQRFDVPGGLEAAILCCLAKDPKARFAHLGGLALALAPFAPPHSRVSVERILRVSGLNAETRRGTDLDDVGATFPADTVVDPVLSVLSATTLASDAIQPRAVTPVGLDVTTLAAVAATPKPALRMKDIPTLESAQLATLASRAHARPTPPLPRVTEAEPQSARTLILAAVGVAIVLGLALTFALTRPSSDKNDARPRADSPSVASSTKPAVSAVTPATVDTTTASATPSSSSAVKASPSASVVAGRKPAPSAAKLAAPVPTEDPNFGSRL